MNKSTQQE